MKATMSKETKRCLPVTKKNTQLILIRVILVTEQIQSPPNISSTSQPTLDRL